MTIQNILDKIKELHKEIEQQDDSIESIETIIIHKHYSKSDLQQIRNLGIYQLWNRNKGVKNV